MIDGSVSGDEGDVQRVGDVADADDGVPEQVGGQFAGGGVATQTGKPCQPILAKTFEVLSNRNRNRVVAGFDHSLAKQGQPRCPIPSQLHI